MPQLLQNGLTIQLSPDGSLANLSDWNVDVCREMAAREGLKLSQAHWEILDIMRRYFATYNISTIYKLLKKEIAESLGVRKAWLARPELTVCPIACDEIDVFPEVIAYADDDRLRG